MKKTILLVFLLGAVAGTGAEKTEKKNKVSKSAPTVQDTTPSKGISQGERATEALPVPSDANSMAQQSETMKMEVEAANISDEIPIDLGPPAFNVSFRDVVGFARPGQTERVLSGPVEHMPPNEVLGLAVLDPRQALGPLTVQIPTPPFVRMEVPNTLSVGHWSFSVMDQSGEVIHSFSGEELPKDLIVWDGYKDDVMVVRPGIAYTPVFTVTDLRGATQRYFGDPIQLDVMSFLQGGLRYLEMANDRLFVSNSSDLSPNAALLTQAVLSVLRRSVGTPFRVTIFYGEGGKELAERRVKTLSVLMSDALVLEPQNLSFGVASDQKRGNATQFLFSVLTDEKQ